jgi:capsular polysaccharide biosynthesis protein
LPTSNYQLNGAKLSKIIRRQIDLNQKDEIWDIREVLFLLRKHLKFLIIISVACGLVGYGVSRWVIISQYESDATLIVNVAQSSQSTDVTNDQITEAQQLVNTYAIILKSDTVLNQVIRNLNLNTDAKKLAKSITINGVNQTEVIDMTVRNPDPQTAADIANEIVQVAPTSISDTINAGSVKIISSAKKSDKPANPNKTLNVAISLLAGLIISIVISLVIEKMNNTFTSDDDVQKYLEYPMLGVVPNIKNKLYQIR